MHIEEKKDKTIITLGKVFSMLADEGSVTDLDEQDALKALEFATEAVANFRSPNPDLALMTDDEAAILLTQLYVALPQNDLWDDSRRAIDIAVDALGERRVRKAGEDTEEEVID